MVRSRRAIHEKSVLDDLLADMAASVTQYDARLHGI